MEKLLTTTEFADAIGTSESSLRRWTNSGVIRTARTAGGHRRIARSEAIRFIRESGSPLVKPEVLGLPRLPAITTGKALGAKVLETSLYEALCSGQAAIVNACVAGLFLGGLSVASICDGPIQGSMKRIGELWLDDPRAILTEHRATSICLEAMGMLRQMMGEVAENSPVALGGAPEGDPYLIPSMMAGAVLAEAGYRVINFGPETPLELLITAAREQKAQLVWLSVKIAVDRAKMRTRINELAEGLLALGSQLVIGGTGVESLGIRPLANLHLMQTMTELSAFARGTVSAIDIKTGRL